MAEKREMYLECKNLKLGYGANVVVEDISFRVDKGDYLCIVGENGAGKSTLMKTILRLVKPLGGEVHFSESLGLGDIGFLPQQTLVQKDFPASVYEVVMWEEDSSIKKRIRKEPEPTWNVWESGTSGSEATENFPVDSSRELCSQGHSVQQKKYFCWMSR